MDAFLTNGAISWIELMTGDPEAAAEFYEAVFGWKYKKRAFFSLEIVWWLELNPI